MIQRPGAPQQLGAPDYRDWLCLAHRITYSAKSSTSYGYGEWRPVFTDWFSIPRVMIARHIGLHWTKSALARQADARQSNHRRCRSYRQNMPSSKTELNHSWCRKTALEGLCAPHDRQAFHPFDPSLDHHQNMRTSQKRFPSAACNHYSGKYPGAGARPPP